MDDWVKRIFESYDFKKPSNKLKRRVYEMSGGFSDPRRVRKALDILVDEMAKGYFGERNPVRIPEKVLDWRERQRKGSIMGRKTFKAIERRAAREGYAIPSAVGGKAYWITVLKKYLDLHPTDKTAQRTLRQLLRGSKRKMRTSFMFGRINPIPRLTTGSRSTRPESGTRKFTLVDYDIITERLAKFKLGSIVNYGGKQWKISPETLDLYYKSYGPLIHRGWKRVEDLNKIRRGQKGYYSKRIHHYKHRANPKRLRPIKERASYYKWYLGVTKTRGGHKYRVFTSLLKPTRSVYGRKYDYVFGPFESRAEANRFKKAGEK